MKKDFIQSFKIITLGLLLSAGLGFAGTQTSAPSPVFSGNPETPLYVSSNPIQSKGGSTLTGSILNINGLLSSNSLAVFGNASIPGNGNAGNGVIQVKSLSQANNPSVTTWPAPVCTGSDGKLTVTGCSTSTITCGSANGGTFQSQPTSGLCSNGSTPAVSSAGNVWTWSCGTASCFATQAAAGQFALNVTKSGSGSGTVTSNITGINCGSDCSEAYNSGTTVTLTASPSSGSTFSGWTGACTNTTGNCSVTMTQARNVNAIFAAAQQTYTLSISAASSYTPPTGGLTIQISNTNTFFTPCFASGVTTSPCQRNIPVGVTILMTAYATNQNNGVTWGGDCPNANPKACGIVMDGSKFVTINGGAGNPNDSE